MRLAKLTASTAALLLSSSALMAQEAQSQAFQSVFIDVGGTAVLVPFDIAMQACGLDETTLQTAAQGRFDESGADQAQFFAQMDAAMNGQGGAAATGDAAAQDTASADAGATGSGDAPGTMGAEGGTAAADAGGATGAAGTTGDAGAAEGTTQTANANTTTGAGNATTDQGNTTATATADASGTGTGDASGAAAGTMDTATADASGAAGQDATAAGAGEVQDVQTTAADTVGDAGAMGAANADLFLLLAACQIDQARATELQVDMARTGQGLGFDPATLGLQAGAANQ